MSSNKGLASQNSSENLHNSALTRHTQEHKKAASPAAHETKFSIEFQKNNLIMSAGPSFPNNGLVGQKNGNQN